MRVHLIEWSLCGVHFAGGCEKQVDAVKRLNPLLHRRMQEMLRYINLLTAELQRVEPPADTTSTAVARLTRYSWDLFKSLWDSELGREWRLFLDSPEFVKEVRPTPNFHKRRRVEGGGFSNRSD